MPLNDYTECSSVRAALGLTVTELPDTVVEDNLYFFALKDELRNISSTLITDYAAALELDTTAAETLTETVQLFSTYCVAIRCAEVMANMAPKSLTDGKAGFIRHSDKIPLKTIEDVRGRYLTYRRKVQEVHAEYGGTTAAATPIPTFMAVSTLDTDPVTGE
mgnify:CR=1 FL=1